MGVFPLRGFGSDFPSPTPNMPTDRPDPLKNKVLD
jgi:hypothetical protein